MKPHTASDSAGGGSQRRESRSSPEGAPEQLRSEGWLRFFEQVMTNRLRVAFNAVRIADPGMQAVAESRPLIIYCNHSSWWDAALVPVLARRLCPSRKGYGPIDADALRRYGFMRRLGLFGVQQGSYTGAATFLRTGRRLLAQPDTLFFITPQGRFSDSRDRPLRLQPGLAGLISVVPQVTVVPLAVEYPFWSERTPEALVRFGPPQTMGRDQSDSLADIRRLLEERLAATMDRLALDAISRDPRRFTTFVSGSAGVGGVYDGWRRLQAWRHGERFDPAHAAHRDDVA